MLKHQRCALKFKLNVVKGAVAVATPNVLSFPYICGYMYISTHTHASTHTCVQLVGLLFPFVYARVGEHKMRE